MYGRVFEKMYEGSMAGAGLHVFALWNYMLTKARRGVVEINPSIVAFVLGGIKDLEENTKKIESALDYLQQPDPISRSPDEGGRRIIKEGQFQYHIVNWEAYEKIRQEAENREANRYAQHKHREKLKKVSGQPQSEPSSRFQKPNLLELQSEGLSEQESRKFLAHYESNGWRVGKNPMKSWKGAAAGWKTRALEYSNCNNGANGHNSGTPLNSKPKVADKFLNRWTLERPPRIGEFDTESQFLSYEAGYLEWSKHYRNYLEEQLA